MRARVACLFLIAVILLAVARPAEGEPKKELAALQGIWKVVSLEVNGKAADLSDQQPRWVIKGNKVLYAGKDLAVLTVDATTTPKAVDLKFVQSKKVYEGVYSVEKDTLKICVNAQADGVKERPLKFSTKDKPGWRLLVFERVKVKEDATAGLSGYVGIAIRVDQEKGRVVIADVVADSPAKKGGLKKDDVILKVGEEEVTELRPTIQAVRRAKPGSKLTFRVKRGGKEKDIVVKPGVLPFMLLD
jgi:uncharacterized protein (TIGR03067 family)